VTTDEAAARRSGAYSSVLNAGGMVLQWLIERKVGAIAWWPMVASASVGVLLLGILFAARRAPRLPLGATVFLLNSAAVIGALWLSAPAFAASGHPWTLFEANKLGAVTVALLAPSAWVGLVGIGGYVGAVLIQLDSVPPQLRGGIGVAEPWATVAWGVFAVALLGFRLRSLAIERAAAAARAETEALQRLAQTAVAVRDLANTPLQTLELCTALVSAPPAVLARIHNALHRLRALGQTLSRYDAALTWSEGEVSPDSAAIVAPRAPRRGDRGSLAAGPGR
jgi:hypothetical protein